MKITKRQLRRIIREERQKLLSEVTPAERDEARALSRADAGIKDLEQDTRKITAELLVAMNRGTVTAEPGDAPDELYIMTGADQGVIVKVIKKGRYS
tara:strand:- start:650 stop:940 length:291 start_codon:yes stop_codon:yes gene_type:complete